MTAYPIFSYGQPPPTLPTLEHVFGVLVKVVADLHRDGRSARSAGIKPRLSQALGYTFDEKAYRFTTFRDFLRAAEGSGVIELSRAHSGPDLDVVLPGHGPPGGEAVPLQIRKDLWDDFMDWSPEFERAYDRELRRAFRVYVQAESYDAEVRRIRQDMRDNPGRYVPIEPVAMNTQLEWARTFVTGLEAGALREALEGALRAERPLQEFTRTVRAMRGNHAWSVFRNRQVAGVIGEWARRHDLDVDPVETRQAGEAVPVSVRAPRTPAPAVSPAGAPLAAPPELDVTALRAQVHHLVDRMTVEELLALPVSLGLLHRR